MICVFGIGVPLCLNFYDVLILCPRITGESVSENPPEPGDSGTGRDADMPSPRAARADNSQLERGKKRQHKHYREAVLRWFN